MKFSVDTEELKRMYEVEGLTIRQIGQRINISARTIHRYLKEAGTSFRIHGSPMREELKERDWIYQGYVTDRKSIDTLAAELGASSLSIRLCIRRHGIEMRPQGNPLGHNLNTPEVRRKMSVAKRGKYLGPDNWNWKGGVRVDPERNRYRSKQWVKSVKTRDGWKCVDCGSTEKLHAHHVKRWKHHPDLRYDIDNGKTLCHSCHEIAHGRKLHIPLKQVS